MPLGSTSSGLKSANVIAAFALAAIASLFLLSLNIIWDPGYYGEFGLTLDNGAMAHSWIVTDVVPQSPADKAGISIGDQVELPQSLHDRIILQGMFSPRPGEAIPVHTIRNGQHRSLILRARPQSPLSKIGAVNQVLQGVVSLVWLAVGIILVLLRPSRMTWGFNLVVIPIAVYASVGDGFFSYMPTRWLVALNIAEGVFLALGVVGFLVFCLRFPTDAPTGWRRTVDSCTPYLVVGFVCYYVAHVLANLFVPISELQPLLDRGWNALLFISVGLGIAALLTTYFSARGPEHYRLKWVVFGLICFFTAALATIFEDEGLFRGPLWLPNTLNLLYGVLPLAVAYAVIRHRVIDVRFVLRRSLVIGVIGAIVALLIVGVDWLFSTKLPSSRFEAAAYAGIALLVGFSLNAARQSIARTVDFVFFGKWYKAQERVSIVADDLRRATSKADLHEPLTKGVAAALSLASVALFERVADGGYFRVAAVSWPPGTIWHIMPVDPLAVRVGETLREVDIDALHWPEPRVPIGLARPTLVVPAVAGRRVRAVLLCGAHEGGASLDPDEIRMIRRLCAEAAQLYGRSMAQQEDATTFREQRRASAAPS